MEVARDELSTNPTAEVSGDEGTKAPALAKTDVF